MASWRKFREKSGRQGAAWDAADQLMPVDEHERKLEVDSFLVPVGALMPHPVVGGISLLLIAVAAEFTLLRAGGFAGPAAFFLIAAALLAIAIPYRKLNVYSVVTATMLGAVCWRLVTHGNYLYVGFAVVMLSAFALSLRGQRPYVLRTLMFTIESSWMGWLFFSAVADSLRGILVRPSHERSSGFYDYVIPAVVLALVSLVGYMLTQGSGGTTTEQIGSLVANARSAVNEFSLLRIGILLCIIWYSAGLLRPCMHSDNSARERIDRDGEPFYTGLLSPVRNTLIALFLPAVFGCYHLWKQQATLPADLDLHEWAWNGFLFATGAAVAWIALATWIYRGFLIADSRAVSLKVVGVLFGGVTLAGIGLALQRYQKLAGSHGVNQQLAVQIALLFVLIVVVGICMVKIAFNMNATWLFQRQCWAVACGVFLFLVLPVDRWIHRHNVSCILEGNLRPVTHIANSTVKDESLPELARLGDFEQSVIREGTAAIIANRMPFIKAVAAAGNSNDWTAIQWGVQKDLKDLQKLAAEEMLPDESSRQLAHDRLRKYCQQWM